MKAWVCDICGKTIKKDSKQKMFAFLVKRRDWFNDHLTDEVCGCIDVCQQCLEEKFKKKEPQGTESQTTVSTIREWLEWRIMNAKHNGIKEAVDAFEFVLQCWEEEEANQ